MTRDLRPGRGRIWLMALALCLAGSHPLAARADAPTYERDIRPLFAKRCAGCHNARKLDKPDVSGGLALDSFEAIARGTADEKVIAPGSATASELYRRLLAEDEADRMPQGDEPLPADQRDLIRRWIDAGAPRGEPVAASAGPSGPRRLLRNLDVVLPTEVKVGKADDGKPTGPIELTLKVGPLPAATALAFGGDGNWLAVGTAGRVVLWDVAAARPIGELTDIPGPVHALAFSADARRLAVGAGWPARSGSVRVYSVPDGALVADLEGHEDVVYALAFRPDGAQLASAGFDQTVRLWDLAGNRPAGVFKGHSDFVYDVTFTSDGKTLLSASKDRSVKRFDAATLKGLRTYSGHNEDVLAIAARPDGNGFVSAGNEPQLRWWAIDGEKPEKTVGGHSGPVHELAFSADGSRLISAAGDRTVRLWDGRSGSLQRTLAGPSEWQYAVALSADGKVAAGGGWDGIVRIWEADSGTLRWTLLQPPGESAGEWLALSPTGTLHGSAGLEPLLRWRVGGKAVEGRPDEIKVGE